MNAPRLITERVATNGEHYLLERIHHHGPDTLRVRVIRDRYSATRSSAVTERFITRHGWTVLADLPAREWYDATAACTLATTSSLLGRVAGTVLEHALRDHGSGTVFGERYDDTAWLELPQLAVWLTAEITSQLRTHPDPVRRAVRCATVARPASREIRLNLYGLSTPGARWEPSADDQRILDDIQRLADRHNWHHAREHRFVLLMHVVTDHSAPALHARGQRPGTITTEP